MNQVVIPNEILSALIADKYRSDEGLARRVHADGAEALASLPGVSDTKKDVRIVRNTDNVVHVTLPHYADQETAATYSRKVMSDTEMAQIAGGEIVAAILITAAVSLAGVGVVTTVGVLIEQYA